MTRTPLPTRRHAESYKFWRGNLKCFGTAGYRDMETQFPDEIFLQVGKAGSEIEALARDFAVMASLALQHGCPFEIAQKAMTRLDDGSAAGPGGQLFDLINPRKP